MTTRLCGVFRKGKHMMLAFFIFLNAFQYVYLWSLPYESIPKDTVNLVSCIISGQRLYVHPSKTITISLSPVDVKSDTRQNYFRKELIEAFVNHKLKNFVILNTNKDELIGSENVGVFILRNFIIDFDQPEELISVFKGFEKLDILNRRAKYTITSLTLYENPLQVAEKVFSLLDKYHILDVVLFLKNSTDNSSFDMYSPMPFINYECSNTFIQTVYQIDKCKNGILRNNSLWFTDRVPKAFKFCKLNVMYVDVPPYVIGTTNNSIIPREYWNQRGTEVSLLANIFGWMNISLMFNKANTIGNISKDGAATGALKYVMDGKASVAIGGHTQSVERAKYFDQSYPYDFHSMVWVVPIEHQAIEDLFDITRIVQNTVLYLMALVVILSAILIVLIARYTPNERMIYRHFLEVIERVFLVITNLPVPLLPRNYAVQIIFGGILIYSFFFNSALTTYLTSMLAEQDRYQSKYSTVEDIVKSNLTIYFSPNAEKYFLTNTTLDLQLLDKYQTCYPDNYKMCLDEVVLYKNACFLVQETYANYQKLQSTLKYQSFSARILPLKVVSFPLNIMMTKGFWGFRRVARLLLRSISTGLIRKWTNILSYSEKEFLSKSPNNNTLNLTNMTFMLRVLLIGHLVAGITFIFEIIIFHLSKKFSFTQSTNIPWTE